MNLWIKICANTSLEDALLSADAGADAVGFVFAKSPRQVTGEQAREIISSLPVEIEKIGVFVGCSFGEIEAIVRYCNLTGVQLHVDRCQGLSASLRECFGPSLRILRVAHFMPGVDINGALMKDDSIDAVLLDSRTKDAVGGTGVRFDWGAAAIQLRAQNMPAKVVVAGGLSPENVEEAIATFNPWGVDVASGVEAAPGRKDPDKVRSFIARARSATASVKP